MRARLTVAAIEALLDRAVTMHDNEVRRLGQEDDGPADADFEELYSRDTLGRLLSRLRRQRCRRSSILAGFMLDNIVDREVFAGQADESISDGVAALPGLRQAKNQLAAELGYPDYFSLYLATREYEWVGVERVAQRCLATTEAEYGALFDELIGARVIDRGEFDDRYKRVLHANIDNYPFDALLPTLADLLHVAFDGRYDGQIELRSVPEEIVTFAYTVLAERRSVVTTAQIGGYEQFKAGCHGLGHSLFGLLGPVPAWAALPSDIGLTEALAFSFQLLPALPWFCRRVGVEPRAELPRWARLAECYFERMYAVQVFWERDYYRTESDTGAQAAEFVDQRREQLRVVEDTDGAARPDYRPLCVEFLHGFAVRHELIRRAGWTREDSWRSGKVGRLLEERFGRANLATATEVVDSLAVTT